MITNDTLLHEPTISLGVLDDEMTPSGPTETGGGPAFWNNTQGNHTCGGASQDMQDMTAAFLAAQAKLFDAIIARGGFSWTMTTPRSEIDQIRQTNDSAKCMQTLDTMCEWYGPANRSAWVYTVDPGAVMQPGVSRTIIARTWVASFQECQR